VAAAAALASGVVYVLTLSPTVSTSRDSAELALAAITAGVPHPTGYPTYMMLGHLWVRVIPFDDPGWGLGLLSAVLAAGAVGVVCLGLLRLTGRASAAWLGALVLGLSPVFWGESTVVEVYPLHMLLQALILLAWIRWEDDGAAAAPVALAFVVGLSFTHHLMTLLMLPCVGLAVLTRWRSWASPGAIARTALAGAAPLVLYAYLPLVLAGDPRICWSDLSTPGLLLEHVTGGAYPANLVAPWDAAFRSRLARYPLGLWRQFGIFLVLAPAGILALRSRPRVLWPLVAGYVTSLGFALSYQVIDPDAFFLPSCLFLAVWIAAGAALLVERLGRVSSSARTAATAALFVLPAVPLATNFGAADRSGDFEVYDRDMAALAAAGENAVFAVWGDSNFPLYAWIVHGVRPDLEVLELQLAIRCDLPPTLDRIRRDPSLTGSARIAATVDAVLDLEGRPRAITALPVDAGTGWDAYGLRVLDAGALHQLVPVFPDARIDPAGVPSRPVVGGVAPLGLRAGARDVRQGDVVMVDFDWQVAGRIDVGSRVLLAFVPANGGGAPRLASAHPLGRGLPLDAIGTGTALRDRVAVRIPYDLPPGDWRLEARLATPNGPSASAAQSLVEPVRLRVAPGERVLWRPPPVHRLP
jgi:hypothetical protein